MAPAGAGHTGPAGRHRELPLGCWARLDDLMDTVLEDGPFGGPLAAGAPRGEVASALVGLASLVVQLSAGILVHTI